MEPAPCTLFYDGLCPLCSREIEHYRRKAAGDPSVQFLDITAPDFDPAAHGLDPVRIHRVMHVRVGDRTHTGLDAFVAIWGRIPGHAWMARLARVPGVHGLLWLGYHAFAAVRPYLPRRQRDCPDGACSRPR